MLHANQLSYLIGHVAAVMSKQADQILQEQLDIGVSQFRILLVLQKNPHVQQRFIAASLGQTEASVSRQIKLLKDRGLLTCKRNPTNLRKHITTPTLQGDRITKRALQLLADNFGPNYQTMGSKQTSQLLGSLNALHAIVCGSNSAGDCGHHIKEIN